MTQNRKLTKAAHARSEATGKPFMVARAEIEDEQLGPEPAYRMSRRIGVERFEGTRHWRVESQPATWAVDTRGAWWGYGGSGPNATAKIILEDACALDASLLLCKEFAADVLIHLNRNADWEWITVSEARDWYRERASFLIERAEFRIARSKESSVLVFVEELEQWEDKDADWFIRRRRDRPPRLPSAEPIYY